MIHFHIDVLQLPLARRIARRPACRTLHGRLDLPDLKPLYRRFRRAPAGVDLRQPARAAALGQLAGDGAPRAAAGPVLASTRSRRTTSPSSAASRRRSAATAPSRSRCACGTPLRIAAKVDPADQRVLRADDRAAAGRSAGRASWARSATQAKNDFIGNARALLLPIDWPEPFGLVMIEAMACGTPVIAYGHGSVPEIIDDGVTGFIVEQPGAGDRRRRGTSAASTGARCRAGLRAALRGARDGAARTSRCYRELVDARRGRATAPGRPEPDSRKRMHAAERSRSATSGTWPPPRRADEQPQVLKNDETFAHVRPLRRHRRCSRRARKACTTTTPASCRTRSCTIDGARPLLPGLVGAGSNSLLVDRPDEPRPARDGGRVGAGQGHAAHLSRQAAVEGRLPRTHPARRNHGSEPAHGARSSSASTPTSSTCSKCAA